MAAAEHGRPEGHQISYGMLAIADELLEIARDEGLAEGISWPGRRDDGMGTVLWLRSGLA